MLAIVAAASTSMLAACASLPAATPSDTRSGLTCVDDSGACIAARRKALESLRKDTARSWIAALPDARAYAAGVRLFAYRLDKAALTCPQLKSGMAEAAAAPGVMKTAPQAGLTPAQVSRGLMLSAEVERELSREQRSRCR